MPKLSGAYKKVRFAKHSEKPNIPYHTSAITADVYIIPHLRRICKRNINKTHNFCDLYLLNIAL